MILVRPRVGSSLRFKMAWTAVIVEVVMLSILVWNSLRLMDTHLTDQAEYHLKNLRPLLNASFARPLLQEDFATLKELSRRYMDRHVSYMAIYDTEGKELLRMGTPSSAREATGAIDLRAHRRHHGLLRAYPISMGIDVDGLNVGRLEIDFDTSFIAGALSAARSQALGVAGVEVLASVVLLTALGVMLTRQLGALTTAARGMAAGDLSVRVPVTGGDELALVSLSFNDMAASMAREHQALRESESKVRLLLESTGEAIYGIDLEGHCTFANPACARLLGYEHASDLVDKNMHLLIHHTRPDGSPLPLEQCPIHRSHLVRERPVVDDEDDGDEVLWRKDGSSFPADYRAYPITEDGRQVGAVVAFTDVSDRKWAEQQIKTANEQLERKVEERTAELRRAQETLVKKERLSTLGQLTATVSHELRNPLGTLVHTLYAIRRSAGLGSDAVRLATSLDRADRNVARCNRIIDELLNFARVRELELRPTRIDDWLAALLDDQQPHAGVAVTRHMNLGGFELTVDQELLHRAVVNVFENACHAVLKDGPPARAQDGACVSISTRAQATRVEIMIEDNGIGIPAEAMSHIFEPLYSSKSFGVGLGLPTVKEVMKRHGGSIDVESQPGRGTRVLLCLPHPADASLKPS